MNFPRIYLQIPNYNNVSYLKESIDSVLQLVYPNLEIQIVDDCSEDHSNELLSTLDLPRNFHIKINTERIGRVANYQHAFSLRDQADWVVNLDSDDYYTDKMWLKEAMQIVEEYPDDTIVHVQSNFFSRIGFNYVNSIKNYGDGYYLVSGLEYVRICMKHYGFSHLGCIFNGHLVARHGAYMDDCMHTDFLTAARAALQGNVLVGSKEIGVWRSHEGNQSSKKYDHDEYVKNQVAYYKFFEWSEDYLALSEIRMLAETLDNRELDRNVMTTLQKGRINELFNFIKKEKVYPHILVQSLVRSYVSNLGTEKFSNLSQGLITRSLSVLITLLMLPFILKNVGVADYSWIGVFTTLTSALFLFDFGLTNLITKEITQEGSKSKENLWKIIASQEIVYLLIGLLIFVCLFFSSELLVKNWFFNTSGVLNQETLLRLVSIAILAQWPHSFFTGVLFGLKKQALANYTQLGLTIFKNGGLIFLFNVLSPSIELFFYWSIFISVITVIIQKYYIYREAQFVNCFKYFSFSYIGDLSKLAINISIISFFTFIFSDVNNFLIARWLSKTEFGYYSILFSILAAYIMFCATVKGALFPYISKTVSSLVNVKIEMVYSKHYNIISFVVIPLSVFLVIFRNEVLVTWLDNPTLATILSQSFAWIIFGSLCHALMIIPWAYLIAMAKPRFLIFQTGFLALISLPLLYVLIRFFLFEGASIYWMNINLITLPCLLFYFIRKIEGNFIVHILNSIVMPLVVSIAIGYGFRYWTQLLHVSLFGSLLIAICGLIISYVSILFVKYFGLGHKI